jgi:hypothetical protein
VVNSSSSVSSASSDYLPLFAGICYGPESDTPQACYWQGTNRTLLYNAFFGYNRMAYSAAQSGGQIYTVGDYIPELGNYRAGSIPGPVTACYWIDEWDGSTFPAGGNNLDASAKAIAISGNTGYCAGIYRDPNATNTWSSCYWTFSINSYSISALIKLTSQSMAFGIAVSDGTAYIAGTHKADIGDVPCYWIGTTCIDLPTDNGGGMATSIAVSGGVVYTSGWYWAPSGQQQACYWMGTTRVDLPGDFSQSCAIAVSGGIVYNGGYYFNGDIRQACFWAGNTRTDLQSDSGMVSSIVVNGSSVYFGGYDSNGACYWKDNNCTHMIEGYGSAILSGYTAYSDFTY